MKPSRPCASPIGEERTSSPTAIHLVDLPLGARVRVLRIHPEEASQVSSFGIYAGVEILLKQKRPSYIIQCEEEEIALETSLAQGIWVEEVEKGGET